MLVKTNGQRIEKYPYNLQDLQNDNPQVSFPASLSAELLTEFAVFPVFAVKPPQHDPLTQCVVELPPSFDEKWKQEWSVMNLPASQAEANVRDKRNTLLSATDWIIIRSAETGVEVSSWTAYRQALRDLTKQPGFPWEVQWPVRPDAKLERARDNQGRFIGDDPSTPDVNEAWVIP